MDIQESMKCLGSLGQFRQVPTLERLGKRVE